MAALKMNFLGITLILGLLAGVWAQIIITRPECDSVKAEEAALVAQDYLNAQHTHGYKYALNRVEDIKIYTKPDEDIYVLEVDLLETDCHVLDPTPLANCTVRPKILTAIEGDCDVVLKEVGGVLTVIAFKCKTDESTEDLCLGCASLLPLNDTAALEFVQASLATFNNMTVNVTYAVKEVGRMSSQVVSRGPIYFAEYVVAEANCTENVCTPLHDPAAVRGFCTAKGLSTDHSVDCKMFSTMMPVDAKTVADSNSTATDSNSTATDSNSTAVMPPVVHIHLSSQSPKHGLKHHQLTALHDPHRSDFLSAESAESVERVTVASSVAAPSPDSISGSSSDSSASAEVPVFVVKRDLPAATISSVIDTPVTHKDLVAPVPVCPGRVRFF
ncbi:alpha-2-HS-glycoprotein-like [Spinachia spinachia]